MNKVDKVIGVYLQRYKAAPLVVQSPGRINLIGEHVDYNSGSVIPAAIDRYIYLAIGKREDNEIRIYASDFQDEYSGSVSALKPAWKLWPNYILGVVDEFMKLGKTFGGFNIVVGGDIPLAAGLSSSAAMGCAAAFGLNQLFGWDFSRLDLAKIAQKAENTFVGVQCGLMDQFASLFGKANNFIRLDCSDFSYEYLPFTSDKLDFVLFDSGVKHHLISSGYNKRRQECQDGLEINKAAYPGVEKFAQIREDELRRIEDQFSPEVFKRCLYVVQELGRVENASASIRANNFKQLGELMYLTHKGLKELYEVSCAECDYLVDLAQNTSGVFGARMMGAGFGGCTLNLIEKAHTEEIIQKFEQAYKKEFERDLKVYLTRIGDGSSVVDKEIVLPEEVRGRKAKPEFSQIYPKPETR